MRVSPLRAIRWRSRPGFLILLREAKPDVVVLDLSRANGSAVEMILKIRRQSSVPILAVCSRTRTKVREGLPHRRSGGVREIASPVDVVTLNEMLQQIVRVNAQTSADRRRRWPARPGCATQLCRRRFPAASEPDPRSRRHRGSPDHRRKPAAQPFRHQPVGGPNPCTVLAEALYYGKHRPATDRAIDVVVNRLRTKLRSIGEPTTNI